MAAFNQAVSGTQGFSGSRVSRAGKLLQREFMPGLDDLFAFNSCETNPPLTTVDFGKWINFPSNCFTPTTGALLASDQVAVGTQSLKIPSGTAGNGLLSVVYSGAGIGANVLCKREFSLAFWHKIDAFPTVGTYFWMANFTGPGQAIRFSIGAGALGAANGTGRITVRIRNASFTPTDWYYTTTNAILLADGNFHFYETQYDDPNKKVRFYRDNVLIETLSIPSANTLSNNGGSVSIGNNGGSANTMNQWFDNIFFAVSARRRFWQWRNITDFSTILNRGSNGFFFKPFVNAFTTQSKRTGAITPAATLRRGYYRYQQLFAVLNPFQALKKLPRKKLTSALFGVNGFLTLVNGSFELGNLTGWDQSGSSAQKGVTTNNPQDGAYCWYATCSGTIGNAILRRYFTNFQIGDTITIDGYYKSTHPDSTSIVVSDGIAADGGFLPAAANWTRFTYTIVLQNADWNVEFRPGYNPFNSTVYTTYFDNLNVFLSRQLEPNRGNVYKLLNRLAEADIDLIGAMYPQIGTKLARLYGQLDFLSALRRIDDDGRCLYSYEEELAELIVETLEAQATLDTSGAACVPFTVEEPAATEVAFQEDDPSPLIIFNADQPCCTGVVEQTLSGDPPSPGSEVTFGGTLGTRLMRRLTSSISFAGIKIPGRTLTGGLTFVGTRTDDAQPEPPGTPWSWHIADLINGLNDGDDVTSWLDSSGNGRTLTGAGIRSDGTSISLRPRFYSAGHALGMTNVASIRFPNSSSGFDNFYSFFNFAAANSFGTAGFTVAFIFISPGAGGNPRFLNYKHTDSGSSVKDWLADTTAGNTSQHQIAEGTSGKAFGNPHTFYSNSFGGNPNTIGRYVFRRLAGSGATALKQWFNGTDISNVGSAFSLGQPLTYSCFGVFGVSAGNYVGQKTHWICPEIILYDYALSDSEITDLNAYLATRV